MKGYTLASILGVCRMVHLMPSLTYLTVTGSQKPLEEPSLSVLPFLAPECLVEEEKKKGFSIFRSPLQAL